MNSLTSIANVMGNNGNETSTSPPPLHRDWEGIPITFTDMEVQTARRHLLGGSVWFFVYTAYAWAVVHRVFKAEMSKKEGWVPGYQYMSSIPITCRMFGNKPVLGYFMAAVGGIMLIEGIAFGETGGQFWAIHAMIYSSSALYGLAEIFYYHGWLTLENWDYATFGIMSCNNVLTSTAHYAAGNFGPEHVLILTAHKYMRYSIILAAIGFLAEAFNRRSPFASLVRCASGILVTLWTFLIGVMYFHNRMVDATDCTPDEITQKMVTMRNLFIWAALGVEFYMVALMMIGSVRVRMLGAETPTYELKPKFSKVSDGNHGYPNNQLDYQELKQGFSVSDEPGK